MPAGISIEMFAPQRQRRRHRAKIAYVSIREHINEMCARVCGLLLFPDDVPHSRLVLLLCAHVICACKQPSARVDVVVYNVDTYYFRWAMREQKQHDCDFTKYPRSPRRCRIDKHSYTSVCYYERVRCARLIISRVCIRYTSHRHGQCAEKEKRASVVQAQYPPIDRCCRWVCL